MGECFEFLKNILPFPILYFTDLGLIHFIDQLNEKDNMEIKFKGHLFVLGKLAWEIHSSVYCENK